MWIDVCARRLTELDTEILPKSAERIAMRIWYLKEPICYREEHPTVAAEAWYAESPLLILRCDAARHGNEILGPRRISRNAWPPPVRAGVLNSPGPSLCPYSPDCLESRVLGRLTLKYSRR